MKPLLTIAVLCLALSVSAQQKKLFSWTAQAGFNLSNASLHTDYLLGKKESKPGFQVGVRADYHLSTSFSLQSGLSVTTKGVKHRGGEMWIGGTNAPTTYYAITTNQVYLQVPLKVAYQIPLSSQTKLILNAGPYVAYGIAGNDTQRETTRPVTVRGDEKFTASTFKQERRRRGGYSLQRLDYGVTGGLGATYQRIVLSAGYDLGLPDIGESYGNAPESPQPRYEYKNRNLFITVGYRL
ncbi:porin family protein [Paraflavitalea pollutisoli]|uniref:porin family protein n=1 Tax=Paraflavitalea pollutisoli TaxID=3034143 RepID=UPI0023EAABD2|nr:porin family protein [Paraflavitalea sp. H1-2-19X]